MRKSQYNEEQIIGILREAEGDTPVKVVCARHNVSEATFYKWRANMGAWRSMRLGDCGLWRRRTGG
jgi:putative transposase